MKKKVLFVIPGQIGHCVGYHHYCMYLKDDYDIDVLSFDQGLDKINIKGVNFYYQPYNRNKFIRLIIFIFFSLSMTYKKKYHCLVVGDFRFVSLIGLFSKCNKKIINIQSGSLIDNRLNRFIANKTILLHTLFFHKVIVLSESLKKRLNLSDKKTVISPLGAIKIDGSAKDYNKMNFIYVGNLTKKRRIEDTISGFAMFYKKYHGLVDTKYEIVGPISLKDEQYLKECIKIEGLSDVITIHGRLTFNQLQRLYSESSIGVCYVPITEYYNVQPSTKLFEYSLSGLFTVATDTYENHLYINSDNGILCRDNPQGFYESLVNIFNQRASLNFNKISRSLINYQWSEIVINILSPLIG
jgi:glycosyltransferase involved in cell wall biosynthesis